MHIHTHPNSSLSVERQSVFCLSLLPLHFPVSLCPSLPRSLSPHSSFHVLHVNGCEEAPMQFLAVKNTGLKPEFSSMHTRTCTRAHSHAIDICSVHGEWLKKDGICSHVWLSLSLSLSDISLSLSLSLSKDISLFLSGSLSLSQGLSLSSIFQGLSSFDQK